ncbi:MAG: helix-turn-helix domain-containing protein [Microbacterium sp.]|uniref:helix-turn-helix domain-containing protein n=1 Tax=Microbacterium sp. TaxID=51671 RepID=UPI001AD3F573|nr:helix-turn-helix domain-containing protein [Microbacterium sp.]MBN9155261.1 helix-turn-helix domain-containing protein [Microbacterium sp.]
MPAASTADVFWSTRPTLMSASEVAPFLNRSEAGVVALARNHEIGAYKVSGKWLIARIDVRGFATGDARAMKSDLGLVIDPAPEFTGDVWGALIHLPEHLSKSAVADLLRVEVARLPRFGLEVRPDGKVEREAVVEFLRSVSNFGPHYSAAS